MLTTSHTLIPHSLRRSEPGDFAQQLQPHQHPGCCHTLSQQHARGASGAAGKPINTVGVLLAGGETQAITGNVVAVFTQTEALKSSKHHRQLVRAQMSLPVHSDSTGVVCQL